MLYVTTRGTQDAFTAYRTMNQDRGPDGGLFIPMRMPMPERSELLSLGQKSFGQNVADVLNLFFGTKLSAWDVDVAIGKNVSVLKPIGNRVVIGELWHNVDGAFDRVISGLTNRVNPDGQWASCATDWMKVAVRIAVIFGVFGQLLKSEQVSFTKPMDVAVTAGDFASPMALWYAREMGLPIGNIICGCNDNGAPWDLLHRGAVNTDAVTIKTTTPEADFALPVGLERLICATLGHDEVARYTWCCMEGRLYEPPEARMDELHRNIFAAVVSKMRVQTIISSVYRTNQYILDIYSALAYGALSDYRSSTGSFGTVLLLTEKSPMCHAAMVAEYMHISTEDLKRLMAER